MRKRHIPVFTSVTNDTLPYLAVTLKSISDFTNGECIADVRILTSGLAAYNQRKLRHLSLEGVELSIVDINRRIEDYRADLEERLGYFGREASFYPFFIAASYPKIARAFYIECGSIVRRDIEELYRADMGGALISGLGRVGTDADAVMTDYVTRWVGVDTDGYVSTSAMLINLTLFRKYRIENRFIRLITGYNFDSVSAADDYMNFLCKGRTKILDCWTDGVVTFKAHERPWRHVNLTYADEFWDLARKTPFYDEVRNGYFDFNETEKEREIAELEKLLAHAKQLSVSDGGFYGVLGDNYLI